MVAGGDVRAGYFYLYGESEEVIVLGKFVCWNSFGSWVLKKAIPICISVLIVILPMLLFAGPAPEQLKEYHEWTEKLKKNNDKFAVNRSNYNLYGILFSFGAAYFISSAREENPEFARYAYLGALGGGLGLWATIKERKKLQKRRDELLEEGRKKGWSFFLLPNKVYLVKYF